VTLRGLNSNLEVSVVFVCSKVIVSSARRFVFSIMACENSSKICLFAVEYSFFMIYKLGGVGARH